jgi:zinc transporter, ZIP family
MITALAQINLFAPNVMIALGVTLLASLSTALGSMIVMRADKAKPDILAFGLAFSAGAMVYVSMVEIFAKSTDAFAKVIGYTDKQAYTGATLAFFAGIFIVLLLDRLLPNPHGSLDEGNIADGQMPTQAAIARLGLLAALAITAHNFPEGLATFFATLDDPAVGAPLAIAIAVHNIPEGISIAVPVYYATGSRKKAFFAALLSGLAEPIGALIGYLVLAPFLSPFVYGSVFGIISGVMVFLSLDELLPAAKRYATGHQTVYGMVTGMALVALSLVLFR